jgi:predicted peptidase
MRLVKRCVMASMVVVATSVLAADPTPQVTFEPRVFTSAVDSKDSLPYVVAKPAGWDAKKKYPLLVFLHGSGERGSNNKWQLNNGRGWMERVVAECHAVVIAPQCPYNSRWAEVGWDAKANDMPKEPSQSMRLLFELLPVVEKEFGIDPAQRYITGVSMGGFGTWDALCRRPDYFAAGIPICGGADEKMAVTIARIPVWVFHGADDGTVLPIRSRNMVEALKKAGGNPIYTEYPGVGHVSWDKAYAEPDLLKWLFSQRRVDKAP